MFLAVLLALTLAWRMVGGKPKLRDMFIATAYMSGPYALIAVFFVVVGDGLFKLIDPDAYAFVQEYPRDDPPESAGRAALVPFVVAVTGFAAAYIWLVFAWGAYRVLTRVSRTRSAVAFVIYNALSIPLVAMGVIISLRIG